MGRPFTPLPVTLICGIIASEPALVRRVEHILSKRFGPIALASAPVAFDTTTYYEKEMGGGLRRSFIAFERLIDPSRLVAIKTLTNTLEKRLAGRDGRRRVNLDPGYVSLSKMVLATTKSYAHRIYVGRGLFEEVTLFFKDGFFQPAPWTYPDLRDKARLAFFKDVRAGLITTLSRNHDPADLSRSV